MELNSKNIKKILLVVFLSSLIVGAVFKINTIFSIIGRIYSLLTPIITALCIAFIFNVLLRALENRVFKFMGKSRKKFVLKMRRPLCLVLTYLLAFGIISLLVLVIIPDLIKTVLYIVDHLPGFLSDIREWIIGLGAKFKIPEEQIPLLNLDVKSLAKPLQNLLSAYSNKIVNGAVGVTSSVVGGVYNAVFSVVISVYILAQKERIGAFVKKIIDAYIPKKIAKNIYHISHLASDSFSRFIGGQLIEAVILALLCYIGMLIFRFPNAAIISIFIGVTSLVPIIGAFTGVAIGFLLIVITNPFKAFLFIVFFLVLQQIEGNLIYPRVVGKAVGLPGVIVISAVLLGGSIGGLLGALLSVPLSALAFTLLKESIKKRTAKKVKIK